jgi:hypothetical protein
MSNSVIAVCLFLSWAVTSPMVAQSSAPPPYTLHTQTRVVLTDVTITDANGNPVHNLSRSAFHIFDDKKPQDIASFEEHTSAQPSVIPTASPSSPHTFSNDFLLHPPPVFNVVVLYTATIDVRGLEMDTRIWDHKRHPTRSIRLLPGPPLATTPLTFNSQL